MQKFLVIQTAFIGDVVLATAVAEKLHHQFPQAQIDVLVRKGNETLFEGHPFIRKVWVWNKKENKFRNLLKLGKELRREIYGDVINLQRFFSSGLLTILSGAKVSRGFDKNPLSFFFQIKKKHVINAKGKIHEIERNQLLIADITDPVAAHPRLYPTIADTEKVSGFKNGAYICCAPASVWHTKQYPKSYWIDFINKIPAHVTVYLIGGQIDHGLCEEITVSSENTRAKNLCGKLSYLESASLMKDAQMNYVNDSAPIHFASAVNAPVAAIFCSTISNFGYGPLSDKKYLVEINYSLYCRPCGLHGHQKCPQQHFKCAHDIPHHRLIEILNESTS
ncbi:MAG TPA: glycosyltransferase family 9 protein [Sphingobacteriaceae bacterium]|nr:glycosyltransferase family 9 protein [Sphingobacteriaceae bacterium]